MAPSQSTSFTGTSFALLAALLFGTSTPLAKVFLSYVDPWMLAGLLFLGGGLGLTPFYLIRNRVKMPDNLLKSEDGFWLGASILAGGVLAPALLMVGLSHTPASTAALLLNFEAVFTALLAWTVFRERWHWQVFGGIVAITIGGIVLTQSGAIAAGWSWGALAILGTCLTWAMDSNFTREVSKCDSLQVALLKSGVAGLVNVVLALLAGQSLPPFPILISVLAVGFLAYGLTLICFVVALRYVGASRTGAYFALSPFIGATIATLFLGESLTVMMVIAALLMAVGVGLCIRSVH